MTPNTSHVHRRILSHTSIVATSAILAIALVGTLTVKKVVEEKKILLPVLVVDQSTPTPTPTANPLESMSPAEKIGQLFMVRIPGDEVASESADFIATLKPGGIILIKENITDATRTHQFVDAVQSLLTPRAFVAVDQEGGSVLRLPWDTNLDVGGDHTSAMIAAGVNTNLAPVLDRATPDGYIRQRALATDSATIIKRAQDMITPQHGARIVSVGKHFPGIGRSTDDPHARVPLITASMSDLDEDVAPFARLAPQLDMIMTSHVRYSALDAGQPSTFSYQIATRILRERIQYTGVAITDDLNMESVVGQRDKYVRALIAGHDILLTLEPTAQVKIAFDEIALATRSGRLRMDQIDAKVQRILDLKSRYGLLQ